MRNLIGFMGLLSVFIGFIVMMVGDYLTGFFLLLFGLSIAVVMMFWSFGGTFQDVIDRHTGIYTEKDEKGQPVKAKRKW